MSKPLLYPILVVITMLLPLIAETREQAIPSKVLERADSIVSLSIVNSQNETIHSENTIVLTKSGIVAASCYAVSRWFDSSKNRMTFTLSSGRKIPADFMLSDRCERGAAFIKIDSHDLPDISVTVSRRMSVSDVHYIGGIQNTKPAFKPVKLSGTASGSFRIISQENDLSGPVFNNKGEFVGLHTMINYVKGPYYSGITSAAFKDPLKRYTALMKKVDEAIAAAKIKTGKRKDVVNDYENTLLLAVPKQLPAIPDAIIPEHEMIFNNAVAMQKALKNSEAAELYKKAISIKKDFLHAHINLGILLFSMGSYTEAADVFRNALKIDQKSSFLNNRLGTALLAAGRYSDANEAFRQAVHLNPSDTEAHFNLGVARFLSGNRQDAWVQYVILRELDQEKAKRLLNLIN